MDLAINLIYTILWTVEGVTMPRHCYELVYPVEKNIWRFIIDGFIILFTVWEIKKQVEGRNSKIACCQELMLLPILYACFSSCPLRITLLTTKNESNLFQRQSKPDVNS